MAYANKAEPTLQGIWTMVKRGQVMGYGLRGQINASVVSVG